MSWQAYVDTSLVGTGNLDRAAIFNTHGTSVWASTHGFAVSPAEIKEVIDSYSDTSDVKKIQSGGFRVAGEKYMTIKADEKSVYGKKVHYRSNSQITAAKSELIILQGKEGIVIVKTQQAILVAHYPETVQPGQATNTVEQLGDYLIGVGY
ncbi:MAG: profilin, required for normal timing of actin polymerization in response to thermal stress [Alectoria fallacina]|uniref:Profilin n=1 Tax=Alectoria fallacina TaxID=1903189 RepID=A0A8H3I983_9LECA|nr:MAG: profilin, required for normal timing of actin polymerization in response to thermal stress [Alectoria fallacina]